jgi:hypothetical protein
MTGEVRAVRVALTAQAAMLVALILAALPDYLDGLFRPLHCRGWCMDFRGLAFYVGGVVLVPPTLTLMMVAWRWRGENRRPLYPVIAIDVAGIVLGLLSVWSAIGARTPSLPPYWMFPLLVLMPALVSLILVLRTMRRLPWQTALVTSVLVSLVLTLVSLLAEHH